jgi:tetratricopeptide (TPR) repeat protein
LTSRAESYSKIADTTEKDKRENLTKALADFVEALQGEPKDSELLIRIYYGMGNILFQQGELAEALTAYTYAEGYKPTDTNFKAELLYKKGLSCFLRGFFRDAIEELKRQTIANLQISNCALRLYSILPEHIELTIERKKTPKLWRALDKALKFKPVDVNLTRSIYLERADHSCRKRAILYRLLMI